MGRVAKNNLSSPVPRIWSRRSSRRTVRETSPLSTGGAPTLLWIDDFAPALELYKATMEMLGFQVLTASSGEAGVKLATMKPIDLVITDYEMPGMNGEAVAATIKSMDPKMPVIIFSGNMMVSQRCRRYADAFCDKAGNRDRLLGTIQRLLHSKRIGVLQPPPPVQASHHERRTVA
jgi:DNA-binding NtrC family response regulator